MSTTALIVTNQRHSDIEGLLSKMAPKGPSSSAQHGGQADGSAADVLAGGANDGAGLLTSTAQVRCSQTKHLSCRPLELTSETCRHKSWVEKLPHPTACKQLPATAPHSASQEPMLETQHLTVTGSLTESGVSLFS